MAPGQVRRGVSPPGGSPATQPTPEAKREASQLSQRVIVREAHKVVLDLELNVCGSRLKRLVRRYTASGRADLDFRTWFTQYADPTGEAAVRNVVRGRR